MFPIEKREALVKAIRKAMAENYRGDNIELACLSWADMTERFLRMAGYRTCIQAGSAFYKRVPGDPALWPHDDSHFSYVWDGSVSSMQVADLLLNGGHLPEMHVWVALPDSMEIIDLTTCYVASNCERLTGLKFLADPLPDYYWRTPDYLPAPQTTIDMVPDLEATKLALLLLNRDVDPASFTVRVSG